jgi:hypothetical protein
MRIFPLPSQQEKFNAKINRSMKSLLVGSIACLLGSASLVAAAWWVGPHKSVVLPSVIGPDSAFLGSAVVVTPEFAICTINNVPAGSSIEFQDRSRVPVEAVRAEAITGDLRVTLLRINGMISASTAPVTLSEASTGLRVEAASTEASWEGTISEVQDGLFQAQPAISISPGAPVQDVANHAMVGLTGPDGIIVSTQRLVKAFPELRGSR